MATSDSLKPVSKQSLADELAVQIKQLIVDENYRTGDRLPSIRDMAKSLDVGHPTVREALRKLETLGIVQIKHGSGVYVGKNHNLFILANPIIAESPSKTTMIDLIETRMLIEVKTAELAARHATDEHLTRMTELLAEAGRNLDDDALLSAANMSFHREIASAAGNSVMEQVLEVLSRTFFDEQRSIIAIYGSRKKDHEEHVAILEAIKQGDADAAVERMRAHLNGVREVIRKWNPDGQTTK